MTAAWPITTGRSLAHVSGEKYAAVTMRTAKTQGIHRRPSRIKALIIRPAGGYHGEKRPPSAYCSTIHAVPK